MKKLIITADDYGMTDEVNKGIKYCCENGTITGVSILANGKLDKVRELEKTGVSFGVHLNLTYRVPLSPLFPNDLKENGKFPKYFRKNGVRQYEIEQAIIKDEYERQIDKVASLVEVSYLDCHHHLHEVPIVQEVVIELAQKYNFAVRAVNGQMSRVLKKKGILSSEGALLDFFAENATSHNLFSILSENGKQISELVTHPGYISKEIDDDYNEYRLNELNVLNDAEVVERIKKNYELMTYKDLLMKGKYYV